MTKRLIIFLLVLAVATVGSVMLYAQQADQNAGQGGEHHGEHMGPRGGGMNSQAMLDHMTKELNLTADQQTKIKTILDDQQKQAQSVREDTSLSQQDRMSKMREIHKSTVDQIRAQLNSDQQTKFDEMQKQMMEHRGGRGGPGGEKPHGDQPSSPPPQL